MQAVVETPINGKVYQKGKFAFLYCWTRLEGSIRTI